jgi:hypothetical protein
MDEKITRERCEICGNHVPGFNTVYLSSEEKLTLVCLKCYNQRISDSTGFDYEHVEFEPIIIKDIDGVDHKFHFTVRLLGDRVAIDTFEIKDGHPGGYEFSVIGDIEKELFELFGKLFERIRQTLNRKHIYWSATTQKWQITDDDLVRGKIDCDLDSPDYERRPLIVIDGKEISWRQFGQMLMTYEGFNFKLEIFDKSDEIP